MRDFKGPWEAYADHQTNKGSFDVFTSDGYLAARTASHERMQLIAAAPELLEALQSIVTTDADVMRILSEEQRANSVAAIKKALGQ